MKWCIWYMEDTQNTLGNTVFARTETHLRHFFLILNQTYPTRH